MSIFRKKPQLPVPSGSEGEIDYKERLRSASRNLRENLAWTDLVCPAMAAAIRSLEDEILDDERLSMETKERLIASRIALKRTWEATLAKLGRAAG